MILPRATPILPAEFLENYEAKSKQLNSGRFNKILENGYLKTLIWLMHMGKQLINRGTVLE